MPSFIQKHFADTEAFLRRHRLAYLRGVGGEIGITQDVQEVALREAVALIELARDLAPRPVPVPGRK